MSRGIFCFRATSLIDFRELGADFMAFSAHKMCGPTGIGALLISNDALAALTLFIASSKPEEMDTVKKLAVSVLNRNHSKPQLFCFIKKAV